MRMFNIKSSLAAGLAHRLDTMDAQTVVDALGMDPVKAIRSNQKVVAKIREANKVFEDAVHDTEEQKRAVIMALQDEYKTKSEGLDDAEKQKMGRDLTADFNKRAAEIQKESKAKPDEIVAVALSEDEYDKALMPLFKKTVGLWDVEGNGGGQKLFLEVAEALETTFAS